MSIVTYAIGDIHGRLDLLNDLLDMIGRDAGRRGAAAKIVFTGDYVDRGPESFGVIERLLEGPTRPGDRFVCLRGNHDDLFIKAITVDEGLPNWAWLLFWHTLESYGVDRESRYGNDGELRRHAAFLSTLPLTHDDGTYLFVHAGIRPGVPLDRQTAEDLTWIREGFLDYALPLPRRIVHGHTIMEGGPVTTVNRISIDTGAFRTGILTAAVLDAGEVSFLQAIGEPDRGAIVREAVLRATILGYAFSDAEAAAHEDYLAGRISLNEMERRTLRAAAA